MNRKGLAFAVATTIVASGLLSNAAEKKAEDKGAMKVKCLGISKKGGNDCANPAHGCAGKATADMDKADWKFVASKEVCEKQKGKVVEDKAM